VNGKPTSGDDIFGEGQEPETLEVPKSFGERLREHPFAWGAVAAALVVVIGLAAAYALNRPSNGDVDIIGGLDELTDSPDDSDTSTPGAGSGGDSKDADAESDDSRDTNGGSGTGTDGDSSGSSDSDRGPAGAVAPPEPFVAYRLEDALWVSREDGTAARRLADSARGSFALSPDAKTLAYIDGAAKRLHLVDVASGDDSDVGPAENIPPCWSPDSSALAYTGLAGAAPEVRVVGPKSDPRATIGAGHTPRISRDGKRIAFIAHSAPGEAGTVVVADIDGTDAGGVGIKTNEVVWGGDGLIYATGRGDPDTLRLMTAAPDGSASRELVRPPRRGRPVIYASISVSPDGQKVAYAAQGDDGFSRAYVLTLPDDDPVELSVRRDTYPLCWSTDSTRVFFIEGNAFQGEATSLLSAVTDGTGRTEVVAGAGL